MKKDDRGVLSKGLGMVGGVVICLSLLSTRVLAIDVFSDPVGFYKVPLNPGPNFISAPLHKIHDFRGAVQAVTANTVTVNGNPGWSNNQFAPKDGFTQYILLLRKDASGSPGNEGDWWRITANSGNVVTVNPGADNLTAFLASGDQVEIRHLVSIADLFGTGTSVILNKDTNGDPNTADEDVIRYMAGASFGRTIFFHDSGGAVVPTGYYVDDAGPFDGATITLDPDQAITVFRKLGSPVVNVLSLGQVQVTRLTHYLQPGANPIGTGFPANAPIGTASLKPENPDWVSDSDGDGDPIEEDLIRVVSGTSFTDTLFHHDGSLADPGWYLNGELNNNANLLPGAGYVFFVKQGTGPVRWRQKVPFLP